MHLYWLSRIHPRKSQIINLEQLPPSTLTSVTVNITSPRLLLLKGWLSELRRLEQLVQQFDQAWQVEEVSLLNQLNQM